MNNNFLKHQNFDLEVLTPIHIGDENNLEKIDYIVNERTQEIFVIDPVKLMALIKKKNLLTEYFAYLQKNHRTNNLPLADCLNKFKINDSQAIKSITKYTLSTESTRDNVENTIKCMTKDIYTKPFIPGSSIKGAIRTAIAINYILNYPEKFNALRQEIVNKSNNVKELNRIETRLMNQIFKERRTGDRNRQYDHQKMSGLSIGDTSAMDLNQLILVQKSDLIYSDNEISDLPVFMECLKPKTKTQFSMTIDVYKLGNSMGFTNFEELKTLLKVVEDFYIGENGIYQAFENLDIYLPATSNTDMLLFIGGNVGFQSKTVIPALFTDPAERLRVTKNILHSSFRKHKHNVDNVISPRTLKIADNGNDCQLMGICAFKPILDKNLC